jgi:hypothetical protein
MSKYLTAEGAESAEAFVFCKTTKLCVPCGLSGEVFRRQLSVGITPVLAGILPRC